MLPVLVASDDLCVPLAGLSTPQRDLSATSARPQRDPSSTAARLQCDLSADAVTPSFQNQLSIAKHYQQRALSELTLLGKSRRALMLD